MQIRSFAAAFATAAVLMLPGVASAQNTKDALPTGKWSGTITPPGAESAPVNYIVKTSNDTVSIIIDAGPHGSFDTSGVVWAAGKLSFSFSPGPKIDCTLTKVEEALYVGECTEGPGRAGRITMVPPKETPAASK